MPTPTTQPKKTWGARLWRIARITASFYLILLVLLMFFEESMIFFPAKHPTGYWGGVGLTFEDAWITTADGVKIHGWYLPCDDARGEVLFAHGNAGNITHRDELMRALHDQLRVSALFFDYRGYGRSEGSPDEKGILLDARAVRDWLANKTGVKPQDVILMAESIGGAVMVDLAAKDGARALILENTFDSLPAVAAAHLPWIPTRLLMRTRLNSVDKIGDYHGPYLQFHGTRDSIVPFYLGERLFAAANEPKRFVPINNGNHNDAHSKRFFDELEKFLAGLPPVKK